MLSSLSRIFQASQPSLPDRSRPSDTETGTTKAGGLNENDLRLLLEAQHLDSTPLLTRHHPSHLSLHSGADSPRAGPSHVSWKTPQQSSPRQSGQDSPSSSLTAQPMWGTQPMSRAASASSPSLLPSPLSTASASQTYRPSSVGKRSSLSVGFTADSANVSEDSDGDSVHSTRSHNVPKQLSPIHEIQHFPPQRKLSLESAPQTPDSTRTFDRLGGGSPAHSAFINRPLKRSTSQTSNSTFRSNVSTAAPTIPPLDLRPDFQNALGVPHGPNSPAMLVPPGPRKSRLAPPALPTVIGSPIQTNKVSVIYEDGASARTSSFITAPSLNSPDAEAPPPVFVVRDYAHSTGTDGTDTEETGATQRASRPLPEGLFDVDFPGAEFGMLRPTSRGSVRPLASRPSTPPSQYLRTPRRSIETRQSYSRSASPASSSESFLYRRWLKGMSFGSDRFVAPPSAEQARRARASHACILFWAGFLAPWCWLIGGWLLTNAGEVGSDGLSAETGPVLPLWNMRRKRARGGGGAKAEHSDKEVNAPAGVPIPEKVKAINGAAERRIKAKSWYPLIAPSLESLAPSTGSGASTRKLKRCLPSARGVDPWIQRCRIAAAASGVLIFAAFVVAIVLVAGVRM
ncbi:hypothetical protein C2E23DRAFT_912300 [Lenzites betulinus]|nr:hypothetical protein C2E23DRAFT_912300 [Lenzites betulinus]